MLEQPYFGRRLKKLRAERNLSQVELAGDGMSTGYLSRLESGARKPTARASGYLLKRLGLSEEEFEQKTTSLTHALTVATAAEFDDSTEMLESALVADDGSNMLLRWQALWLLAKCYRRKGEHEKEFERLEELVELSESDGLADLRSKAMVQLARCLRTRGEMARAGELAAQAYQLTKDHRLAADERALVLMVLISVETEAGQLSDARAHADELTSLVEGRSDALWAEAVWTTSAVRVKQGELDAATALLDDALKRFRSSEDISLWLRLRVAAARLHLLKAPSDLDTAQSYIEMIDAGLPFVVAPVIEQESIFLKAELAFREGRYMDAREWLGRLDLEDLRLPYGDRVRVEMLNYQLLIVDGKEEEGLRGMYDLANRAYASSNIDLTADIWRNTAETLLQIRNEQSREKEAGERESD